MALRIITADDRLSAAHNKTTIALFGASGHRKTSKLKTLRADQTLCLDLEAGLKSVQDWPDLSIPVRTFADAVDIACLVGGVDPAASADSFFSDAHYNHVADLYPDLVQVIAERSIIFVDSITDLTRQAMAWSKPETEVIEPLIKAVDPMPMAEIVALPAAELARLQKDADDNLRKAKLTVDWLDGALIQKYAERAKIARAEADKGFGVARFTNGDVTVVADLPKKVDWDQHELSTLVERINAEGEDPRDYVEVSLRVSESKYTSWPKHIARIIEPARTVRAGKESFQLVVEKEGI